VSGDLRSYYDRLARWTRLARWFGYGGGSDQLTVHRALSDPRAHGSLTTSRLHDVIADSVPLMRAPRVLDAGCGFGGTIIDLERRMGGSYVGITLSEEQASVASRALARAGLRHRARIEVRSYDNPPSGPYDLVLAVESLAHSANPAISLSALTLTLAPGGVIVIVDDMPHGQARAHGDLGVFASGWHCPVLWSLDEYRGALETSGLTLIVDRDLSDACRPRSLGQIARLERLNRAARALVPSAAWRSLMDSYYAGLALERLYRRGLMQYRLLIARR
jgi:SAM-dependent methyltransferase